MKQEKQVQQIDRIFSVVILLICFTIILIYLQFIARRSIPQFMSSFITAPTIIFRHKGRAVFDWYLYFFADITLLLTGCSLFISRINRIRFFSESLTIFFLLILALVTAGTVTLKDPYLYIVVAVTILYAILIGYREQSTEGVIRLLRLGTGELGFTLKLILSIGILVLLTLSGIGLIHLNLPFWIFNPLLILYAVFIAPILEELFFRVYLLNRINESIKNSEKSVIISSIFFSFGHVDFLVAFPHYIDLSLLIGRFFLGFIFGSLYLSLDMESMEHKQKQLWLAILGHGLSNFFVIFIYNPFIKPLLPVLLYYTYLFSTLS